MGSFGLAHILYILAFGFKPLKLKLAFLSYSISSITIYIYFNAINDPILKYGVLIYTILIFTMIWRSLAGFEMNSLKNYYSVAGIYL
jgi:uncharacterized membrane protein YhhN